jgi:hypothetical protein
MRLFLKKNVQICIKYGNRVKRTWDFAPLLVFWAVCPYILLAPETTTLPMKSKILLAIPVLMFVASAVAQPVLNTCATHNAYGTNSTVLVIGCDTNNARGGAAGANVTWDFTGLIQASSKCDTTFYYDPSTTPGTTNFPGATIATWARGGQYTYYANYADSLMLLGSYLNATAYTFYDHPSKQQVCPFIYLSSFNIKWRAHAVNGSSDDHQPGNRSTIYDGYGTLKLPIGTYTNVMRFREVQTFTDSVFGFGLVTHDSTFLWVDSTGSTLLNVTFTYLVTSGAHSKSATYYTKCSAAGINSISSADAGITIYPNPSVNNTYVEVSGLSKENTLSLYSVTGQKLWSFYSANEQTVKVPVQSLPGGIYFLKVLRNDGSTITKRVEVVK